MSDEPQTKILTFVRGLKKAPNDVDVDSDLISTGILDSLSVMELIAFLSKTFDVSISAADITPVNLKSVSSISALVEARKS